MRGILKITFALLLSISFHLWPALSVSQSTPTPTPTPGTRRVNFQPDWAATPAGYDKDDGSPYGTHGEYGWVSDSDGDGLPDWWEWEYFGTLDHGPDDDYDEDDLTNIGEFNEGADPTNPDTDGEGYFDGEEVTYGSDPTDASDIPYDTAKIVISEVLYDADSGDNGKVFVEIFGPAGFDVSDYRIKLLNGNPDYPCRQEDFFVFPSGAVIPNDGNGWGYLVVADGYYGATEVPNYDYIDNSFDPQNGPDNVVLKDSGGAIIDSLGYGIFSGGACFAGEGDPAPDVSAGTSLERAPYSNSDTGDNLTDFAVQSSPTSGEGPIPSTPPQFPPKPQPGDVVINEIAWSGTAALPDDEWIELYNASNHAVDLEGSSLSAEDGAPDINLHGTVLAYQYYILERGSDSTISDIEADLVYSAGSLADSGELLELRNDQDELIDSANSTGSIWFAGNAEEVLSMERIDIDSPGEITGNWKGNNGTDINGHDSLGDPIYGTPGQANSPLKTVLKIGSDGINEKRPIFSPDSSQVAYQSDESGNWDIFIIDANGSGEAEQITTDPDEDERPCWSPDGSRLGFDAMRFFYDDYDGNVWLAEERIDGSWNESPLIFSGWDDYSSSISPDNSYIAYIYWVNTLKLMNITSREIIEFAGSSYKAKSPAWSPDMAYIAYHNSETGDIHRKEVDSDGNGIPDPDGEDIAITTDGQGNQDPRWFPDESLLVFSSEYGGNGIWVADLETPGYPAVRITDQHNIIDYGRPDFSPDGSRIVYHSDWGGDDDLYLVDFGGVAGDEFKSLANITAPLHNESVSSTVSIVGTADDNVSVDGETILSELQYYRLEYKEESSPDWTEIAYSTTPVTNDELAAWDTFKLPSGAYYLRLTVGDTDEPADEISLQRTVIIGGGISNVSISRSVFNPSGNLAVITADLAEEAEWCVRIYDGSQQLVNEICGTGTSVSAVWDGTGSIEYNGGVVVPDGLYTYEIEAISDGKTNLWQGGTVEVDSSYGDTAIDIVDVSALPQFFNPAVEEECEIHFILGMDADVTVSIYRTWITFVNCNNGKTQEEYAGDLILEQAMAAGEHVVVWDGQRPDTGIIQHSAYKVKIVAQNGPLSGEYFVPADGIYCPDEPPPSLFASYSVSAENGTRKNQPFEISFTTEQPCWITIGHRDADLNEPIEGFVLLSEPREAGSYTENWDGRDASGGFVEVAMMPNINFVYSTHPLIPNAIVTRDPDLEIDSLTAETYVITPSYSQVSTIMYSITREAKVRVDVYDPDEIYFTTIQDDTDPRPGGSYEIIWDGRHSETGELVYKQGDYRVEITVEDPTGYTVVTRSGNLVVH